MGRVGILVAVLAAGVALLLTATSPITSAEEACGFLDGFRALRDEVGAELVGDCLEHSRSVEGGTHQRTTGGLLVWDETLNLVSFTDGHQTWIAGPNGIEARPNAERFAWEEEALRAAEAEAAARGQALRAPSPHQLALLYVERVRGNNDVSLEKIYLTALHQAQHNLGERVARVRGGLSASMGALTARLSEWVANLPLQVAGSPDA